MGGHPKTTTQTQANTYSQVVPQNTPDIDAFRKWEPQVDPGIGYQYARARDDLKDTYDNPLGAYTTPAVKEAALRSGLKDLNQQEGQAFRAGEYDVNAQKLGQLGGVAELTAPRIVQSGSTGSQTTPGQSIWPTIISSAAGVGASAL